MTVILELEFIQSNCKDYMIKDNLYNDHKLHFIFIFQNKKEIADCISHYNCRPVEWLYNNNEIKKIII